MTDTTAGASAGEWSPQQAVQRISTDTQAPGRLGDVALTVGQHLTGMRLDMRTKCLGRAALRRQRLLHMAVLWVWLRDLARMCVCLRLRRLL